MLVTSNIEDRKVVELGYIFDDAVWGQGYATEAAGDCIRMAFTEYGIECLYCTMRPENVKSIRVAERLGMQKIGEYTKIYKRKQMAHLIYILDRGI